MNAAVPPRGQSPSPSLTRPWQLSVVVPACNAARSLPGTLDLLTRLPGGPPTEIIVVENGSEDDTWQVLEAVRRSWDAAPVLISLRLTG